MKKYFALLPFLVFTSIVIAQKFKTTELKLITKHGGTYYYDVNIVDGGAYGLQIPLLSLNDEEINREYKSFKKWRKAELFISAIPGVFAITQISSHTFKRDQFNGVFIGTLITLIGTGMIAKSHFRKAINRYNSLVVAPTSYSLGITVGYRF
jgi:hypothetical protein